MYKILILAFALLAFAVPSGAFTLPNVAPDTTIVEKYKFFGNTYTIDGEKATKADVQRTIAQKPEADKLFKKATKGERTSTLLSSISIGFLLINLFLGGWLWLVIAGVLLIPALIIGLKAIKDKKAAFLFFK